MKYEAIYISNSQNAYYQAYHGHDEILHLLLPLFPNTNIKEDSGKTPLDLAAYKGHKQCIVLLLRFGASVAVQVRRTWTSRLISIRLHAQY